MTTTRRALPLAGLAAVACITLAACGGSDPATPPGPAAPPAAAAATGAPAPDEAPARTGDEAAVEAVFNDYYRLLLARDFAGACAFNAPETTDELLANLREQGVAASTCEEGLSAIYSMPGAEATADTIANTAAVDTITVNGEDASITWSAEIEGQRPTVTSGLRRIDGRWLLVDTGR